MVFRDFRKNLRIDSDVIRLKSKINLPLWKKKNLEQQKTLKDFARYVNHKAIFKTINFNEYKRMGK